VRTRVDAHDQRPIRTVVRGTDRPRGTMAGRWATVTGFDRVEVTVGRSVKKKRKGEARIGSEFVIHSAASLKYYFQC
jgi:hypothetical protein